MPPQNQAKRGQLSLYKKSYKGGGTSDEHHWNLFKSTASLTRASLVLYPGCHRHITPSLIFPRVHYMDCDKNIQGLYDDPKTVGYIEANKHYSDESEVRFELGNYGSTRDCKWIKESSYDILFSMSAGLVSLDCTKYVKPDGFFLVSDAHSDARQAFMMPDWKLTAVWDHDEWKTDNLDDCFTTSTGEHITQQQVDESVQIGTRAKRSFRLKYEPMFYLFQKRANDQRQSPQSVKDTSTAKRKREE